jgi:hypothetical protein
MYKLTVTKQEENPEYNPKGRGSAYDHNGPMPSKYISNTHLEVTLTDDEYEAIKKAVLSVK